MDLSLPMGSWRNAWRLACKATGVRYRPHDIRHTFISRQRADDKALAGRQLLERYSHIRSVAKQAAIQALEHGAVEPILPATGRRIGEP